MNVVRIEDFDLKKVKLSEVITNSYGGKSVYLNYDGSKKPLYLSIPSMYAPFGINSWKDEEKPDKPAKYTLVLSFRGLDENEGLKQCHDKLKGLDDFF